jgi:thiamine pyrophosphate-dependent acetolactate synthase large subunit-like protein
VSQPWKRCALQGVTTIFGLMGSSTLEIYDVLYDAKDFTKVFQSC